MIERMIEGQARMAVRWIGMIVIEGQAPRSAVFLGFRSKTAGPKVGFLEKNRVILTNEFLFLDQSPTLPTAGQGLVLRSWPAFGGHLFTDSDEGEKRVIESRDTVFNPWRSYPATGGG